MDMSDTQLRPRRYVSAMPCGTAAVATSSLPDRTAKATSSLCQLDVLRYCRCCDVVALGRTVKATSSLGCRMLHRPAADCHPKSGVLLEAQPQFRDVE